MSDNPESRKDRLTALVRKLRQNYGATYKVVNGSAPHATVIDTTLLPTSAITLDHIQNELVLEIDAYAGGKGNTVSIRIPLEGLNLILGEFASHQQLSGLLKKYGNH